MIFLRICIFCLLIGCAHLSMAATDPVIRPAFSVVMPDLPIMPGMTEDSEAAIVFDKAEGRIIETRAIGAVPLHVIENFYVRALPALGWQRTQQGEYIRKDEKLAFTITKDQNASILIFSIQPTKDN